jgi:hypothetical protein
MVGKSIKVLYYIGITHKNKNTLWKTSKPTKAI